jgi:predicted NodU family carbamoyl transferase
LGKPGKFSWSTLSQAKRPEVKLQVTGRSRTRRDPEQTELMVDDMLAGKVIGLFQDRFGGDRGTGSRSILADPPGRDEKYRECPHQFREPFRPLPR